MVAVWVVIQKTILCTGYRVPLPDTWWVHIATLPTFQELCANSESAATEPYKSCMNGMEGIFPTERKLLLENILLLVHSIYCPLHNVNHCLDAIKEILQRNTPERDCIFSQWRVLRTKAV